MGKTRRHFGRENGDDAKFHRWWRKNENVICRKDHDRTKIAELATATILNEKVSLKTRNTAIPKSNEVKGYGFRNHPFNIHYNEEYDTYYTTNPIDPLGWWEDLAKTNIGGCGCSHSHE